MPDINKLLDWPNKWQMQFNIGKCKVIHFGTTTHAFNIQWEEQG